MQPEEWWPNENHRPLSVSLLKIDTSSQRETKFAVCLRAVNISRARVAATPYATLHKDIRNGAELFSHRQSMRPRFFLQCLQYASTLFQFRLFVSALSSTVWQMKTNRRWRQFVCRLRVFVVELAQGNVYFLSNSVFLATKSISTAYFSPV